jgi:hypothetical protein
MKFVVIGNIGFFSPLHIALFQTFEKRFRKEKDVPGESCPEVHGA